MTDCSKNRLLGAAVLSLAATALAAPSGAQAQASAEACVGKVPEIRVIVQPMPATGHLDTIKGEFESKWQTKVEIVQYGENDRRSRSRLDASSGAGAYQVYYIDEANVAEFAASKWVLPLLDYLPKDYDYEGFLDARKAVAQWDGTPYFAPITGGGDMMIYRKDVFAEKNIAPPKTLDELKQAIAALHSPPEMYGWTARARRGSGMNVWRWTPFFRAEGGQWFQDGEASFNSEAAVKATETYKDLFQFAPPGATTNTWSEVVESFRAGQVAVIVESDPLALWMEDPEKSRVVGKVGFAPPPEPLPSAGYAHGLALSASGNPDDCSKLVSAEFIGWATSSEMEHRRFEAGLFADFARKSSLEDPIFKEKVPAEYIQALADTSPRTSLLIYDGPEWPEIGDFLGLVLEEVLTGTRDDIQLSLDEAAEYANDIMRRSQRQ
ncbi:extracellular solute-binding protein [Geminicoccus flavidas]|uniref:extracellular solute-binding protein n=1 Tax=Geminicoccus flavidas TaxID=2506407 RepID=UPI00135A06D2|nr:extracellular solute-binding protein [Geminicoccus flavidas]